MPRPGSRELRIPGHGQMIAESSWLYHETRRLTGQISLERHLLPVASEAKSGRLDDLAVFHKGETDFCRPLKDNLRSNSPNRRNPVRVGEPGQFRIRVKTSLVLPISIPVRDRSRYWKLPWEAGQSARSRSVCRHRNSEVRRHWESCQSETPAHTPEGSSGCLASPDVESCRDARCCKARCDRGLMWLPQVRR